MPSAGVPSSSTSTSGVSSSLADGHDYNTGLTGRPSSEVKAESSARALGGDGAEDIDEGWDTLSIDLEIHTGSSTGVRIMTPNPRTQVRALTPPPAEDVGGAHLANSGEAAWAGE